MSLNTCCTSLKRFAGRFITPLVLLAMRLYVAKVFFTSGWGRLGYVKNGELNTLYNLFEGFNVPFLSAKVAAWLDLGGELGFSVLLALGLFARFGALGLMVIACVIFHTDGNPLAPYWILICALIAAHGPGKVVLDNILCKSEK